jgi:transmembrane sensor
LSEFSDLWDDLGSLAEISALFPVEDEPEQGANHAWWRAAIAAAALTCIALPAWFVVTEPGASQSAEHSASGLQVFATPVGGMRQITLTDGTAIVLNTDTLLQVEFSSTSRLIGLRRGEAYFDVAPDATRPFRVRAGSHELTAVGTVFNVEEQANDHVELIVTEGTVRVVTAARSGATAGRDATVIEGEVAVFEPGGRQSVGAISAREIEAKLAWQSGELAFQGETLSEVLSEFARYSPTPLDLADSTLGTIPVVGYFETGNPDALFQLLRENFDIEAERRNGRITLRAR